MEFQLVKTCSPVKRDCATDRFNIGGSQFVQSLKCTDSLCSQGIRPARFAPFQNAPDASFGTWPITYQSHVGSVLPRGLVYAHYNSTAHMNQAQTHAQHGH